ncbi:hypothetical protein SDC9_200890 [bioreactor metagenome]|uniref:Uncharacterized protein n=1 Tax=bioreactor metagenome TaxID=1076179 RepID=A0A645IQ61_9ZZZZ
MKQAVLISVDEAGMKGDGQIVAVLPVLHVAGMEGVAVAEQPLSLRKKVFLVVDIILHLPGYDPGKLDLRVPVPQEIPLLVGLDGFRADVDGKFIISMTFDLFLVFFGMYLHHNHISSISL